jgi:hypothetical protein
MNLLPGQIFPYGRGICYQDSGHRSFIDFSGCALPVRVNPAEEKLSEAKAEFSRR